MIFTKKTRKKNKENYIFICFSFVGMLRNYYIFRIVNIFFICKH